MLGRHLLFGLILVVLPSLAWAGDWPQYRGPDRNDRSSETGLLDAWPAAGPALLWTYRDAGLGYSSVAVVADRLYTLGDRGEREYLIAIDLKSIEGGSPKPLWSVELGAKFDFKGNQWSAGPSATPTIDGDRAYALSGNGELVCVKLVDGAVLWKLNLPSDLQAQVNPIGGGPKNLGWGYTWSPLVEGDQLICSPGGPLGTLAALDKMTGRVIWRSTELTDQAAYTSPSIAEIDGVRQYVVLTNQGLRGIATADGKLLWKHEHRLGTEVVNSPIVVGSQIYLTVGTANGNELIKVTRSGGAFLPESVYLGNQLTNHHGNVVLFDGHVYGSGARQGFGCQRFESGEVVWTERKVPTGSVTFADGKLFCYGENDGVVHLLKATPAACTVLSRFTLSEKSTQRKPSGKVWTPPVISGGRLFLRDQELIFCYQIKAS